MKVAFQMEPVSEVSFKKNHSWALIQEGIARGHEVYHFIPQDLERSMDGVRANISRIHEGDEGNKLSYSVQSLHDFDIVFMRQNPPVDINYINNTYVLEHLMRTGVYVTNDPKSVRDTPEKMTVFLFKDNMPKSLVTLSSEAACEFYEAEKNIIIKPLDMYSGIGIIKPETREDVKNYMAQATEYVMVQKFIPKAYEHKKRVVLFDGDVVGAQINTPPKGDFITTAASDSFATELTDEEYALSAKIGVEMKARGIDFVGLDLLDGKVIEINTTSTGTLKNMSQIYGKNYMGMLWDIVEKKAKAHKARQS